MPHGRGSSARQFDIQCQTWAPGERCVLHEGERYRLTSVPVKHRIPCAGLKVEEHSLPWKLDGMRAKRANLPFPVPTTQAWRGDRVGWPIFGPQTMVHASCQGAELCLFLRHASVPGPAGGGDGCHGVVPRFYVQRRRSRKGQSDASQHHQRSGAFGASSGCQNIGAGTSEFEILRFGLVVRRSSAGARGCHCGRGWHGHSNRRLKLASEVISLLGIILNKPLFTCLKPLPLPTAVLFFVWESETCRVRLKASKWWVRLRVERT